jgi:hypothetical protein
MPPLRWWLPGAHCVASPTRPWRSSIINADTRPTHPVVASAFRARPSLPPTRSAALVQRRASHQSVTPATNYLTSIIHRTPSSSAFLLPLAGHHRRAALRSIRRSAAVHTIGTPFASNSRVRTQRLQHQSYASIHEQVRKRLVCKRISSIEFFSYFQNEQIVMGKSSLSALTQQLTAHSHTEQRKRSENRTRNELTAPP